MAMDKLKLPNNYGKNCPKFDGEEPENLEWYLDVIAKDDEEKKWVALCYCNPATAREWKAFKTYKALGTYEEFKKEIILNYPEVHEAEEGSIGLLDRLCWKYKCNKVEINDPKGFMSFMRKFHTEAEKLLLPPIGISNCKLYIGLLGCLEPEFVSAIWAKLQVMPASQLLAAMAEAAAMGATMPAGNVAVAKPAMRCHEDKFEWTDILNLANEIVEDQSVSFCETKMKPDIKTEKHTTLLNEVAPSRSTNIDLMKFLKDKLQSVEQTMVQNMDKLQISDLNKWVEFEAALNKLQQAHSAPLEQVPMQFNSSNWPTNYRMRVVMACDCYYCRDLGHFMGDCTVRHQHIEQGKIKVIDGKTVFFNGKNIPWELRNKTHTVKVEEYRGQRIINQNLKLKAPGRSSASPGVQPLATDTVLQNAMDTLGHMQSFITTHWDGNNQQFVQTHAGTGQEEDF
ncbi:hypothetical protein B0H10DRAFT_1956968 [Mycena sp. CBHHK59/15]|nr:hypothetical protein B0H10DRAFT_1956968 [Mycena sp. CBHHK59/15]